LVDWMEGLSCEHEPVKKHGNESQKFTASERKTDEMNPVRRVVSALHGDCSRVVPGPLQKEIATEHTEVKKPRGLIRNFQRRNILKHGQSLTAMIVQMMRILAIMTPTTASLIHVRE